MARTLTSPDRLQVDDPAPLRAVHTTNFPGLLRQLGASLLVTTYQAGKLVMVRDEGDHLNTHFRAFQAPMGLALRRRPAGRRHHDPGLGVSSTSRPSPPSSTRPAGTTPASCPAPATSPATSRSTRWPGAPAASCGSSTPASPASARSTARPASCRGGGRRSSRRWSRPTAATSTAWRWSTAGPRYVTALGETDAPAGWRANKARGGILMDVASGEVIARGLSMPHSPRWYGGRLWVCESGAGTLGFVDPDTGPVRAVAAVPGFTRGLDFAGGLAFVGLSQVRETAVFSGIPITERLAETSGPAASAWSTWRRGEVVALLRFEDGRAGGLRRAGAARPALPRADQRRRRAAGELVRGARRGAGRRAGGAAGAGRRGCSRGGGRRGSCRAARAIVRPKQDLHDHRSDDIMNHIGVKDQRRGRRERGRSPAKWTAAADGHGAGGPRAALDVDRQQHQTTAAPARCAGRSTRRIQTTGATRSSSPACSTRRRRSP